MASEIEQLEERLGLPDHLLPAEDDDNLRQMIENVEALEALTRHPSWPLLEDAIKADTAALQRKVVLGQCKSWEEYLASSARIKGMLDVLKLPEKARAALPVRNDA